MSDTKISDVVTVLDLVCAPKFVVANVDSQEKCSKNLCSESSPKLVMGNVDKKQITIVETFGLLDQFVYGIFISWLLPSC